MRFGLFVLMVRVPHSVVRQARRVSRLARRVSTLRHFDDTPTLRHSDTLDTGRGGPLSRISDTGRHCSDTAPTLPDTPTPVSTDTAPTLPRTLLHTSDTAGLKIRHCPTLRTNVNRHCSVGQCRGFLTVDLLGQCRAVLECQSVRVSECWSVGGVGVLECRSVGVSRPYEQASRDPTSLPTD